MGLIIKFFVGSNSKSGFSKPLLELLPTKPQLAKTGVSYRGNTIKTKVNAF